MTHPRARIIARLGLALLLAGSASGCMDKLVDFHVRRIEGLRVQGIDGQGFNLQVQCRLSNPNPLGATVRDVRFSSSSGTQLLGSGQLAGPLEVEPRSEFVLQVPLRVAYGRLPADFPRRVEDGTLKLRTTVTLTAETKLGRYTMTLHSVDRVQIARALGVAVQGPFSGQALRVTGIQLTEVALLELTLGLRLQAHNMFAFPVRVRRGTFRIFVNGAHFGDGQLTQPIALGPRSRKTFQVQVRASHGAALHALGAMMGADPRFRVKGTLWIDPVGGVERLPIDVSADASVFTR